MTFATSSAPDQECSRSLRARPADPAQYSASGATTGCPAASGVPALAHGTVSARYLPEIDGLRAIAAISVVAFHTQLAYVDGGFLGVDVFFVLSGYLTASLALSGRYTFAEFMTRRIRRIWPLLLFVSLVVIASLAIVGEPGVHRLITGVLFLENLLQSYGAPEGPMSHTWTLATEMQFYAVISVMALGVPRPVFRWIAVLAFLAGTAMRLENAGDRDWWAGYCGPFSHSSGLFLGAALATLPLHRMPARGPMLAASLITICGAFVLADFLTLAALTTWITVVEVATACAVAAIVAGAGRIGAILRWPPLRTLGLLSYGIYLWHYPISYAAKERMEAGVAFALTLSMSVLLAALTYRLIEARHTSRNIEE